MLFITWAELLQGAEGSLVPVHYPEGPEICRHHAQQATALKRRGTPIGANDLCIACHALAIDATLVGGLLPAALIEQIARQEAPGQKASDYGLPKALRIQVAVDQARSGRIISPLSPGAKAGIRPMPILAARFHGLCLWVKIWTHRQSAAVVVDAHRQRSRGQNPVFQADRRRPCR